MSWPIPRSIRRAGASRARRGMPALLAALLALGLARAGHAAPPAPALPPGFADELVAGGLTAPTAFAFLPDGRILVAEQQGVVRLVKDGQLQETPFLDIHDEVNAYYQRGLLGLAVDAAFPDTGFVYLFYMYEDDPAHPSATKTGRLSRLTASGDTASPASEQVLLGSDTGPSCNGLPPGANCLPEDYKSHNGGGLAVASDGTLFVGTGDGAPIDDFDDAWRAQDLDSLGGKILHVSTSGEGLPSNPFWNGDPAANRSRVWAYGLRNPFRLTLHPGDGLPFVGDVGENATEEIDAVAPGANFGWPCYEGINLHEHYRHEPTCQDFYAQGPSIVRWPFFSYTSGVGNTVMGGVFLQGDAYPAPYRDAFLYADWARGFIHALPVDAAGHLAGDPLPFASDLAGPVQLALGPDGLLYYLSVTAGELHRIRFVGPDTPAPARPPDGTFVARYYPDTAFGGDPAIRLESKVDRNFPADRPLPLTPSGAFSARWDGWLHLAAGQYACTARADDGLRVWLDGEQIVDSWQEQPETGYRVVRDLAEGDHHLQVEYFHGGGAGRVQASCDPSDD